MGSRLSRVLRALAASGCAAAWLPFGFGVGLVPAQTTPVSGTVDSVGWWSSRPTAMAQSGGGFEVASGPDGSQQSVAAMNITVDVADMTTLQITLSESVSVGSQFAHIRVCLAAPGWSPANPGPLSAAPRIDCSGTVVELARTANATWVGDLVHLLPDGGTASLGLIPVSDSPAPVGTGLLAEITGVAITGTGALIDRTVATPATTDAPPALTSDGSFDTPIINLDPGTVANPGSAFEIPTGAQAAVPAPAARAADLSSTVVHRRGPSRPYIRLLFLAPLSVGIGAGLVYLRRYLAGRGVSFS